jgi:hypothetical protein
MSTTKRDEQGRILPREAGDPEAKVELQGVGWFAEDEEAEARKQYADEIWRAGWQRASWERQIPGSWCVELYQLFHKYKQHLDHWEPTCDPQAVDYPEHKAYAAVLYEYEKLKREEAEAEREKQQKALENLEKAQRAARCAHIHLDGTQCGCPKMKDSELCYIHDKLEKSKSTKLDLGPMDDPDSIQVGIARLQSAVIDGLLEPKQVRHLAYLIQLAAWNVKSTTIVGQRWGGE